MAWLNLSIKQANKHFEKKKYTMILPCTVVKQEIKIDKSILELINKEVASSDTKNFTNSTMAFERIFIIAAKDIIWYEPDFQSLLQKDELQFLRHIRNACAHSNKFYFGRGKQRKETLKKLPISWRGKTIEEKIESQKLLPDFIGPGDLFILLEDISKLVKK